MRFKRIIAGTITAGLMGVTPLAMSAPATADGLTFTPVVTFEINSVYGPPYTYGADFYVSGKVEDAATTETPLGGQALLQVLTPSNPVWTTVATDDSPGYLFFDGGFKFTSNAQFKVVFTGYTAANAYQDTFVAAESAVINAPVMRSVQAGNKGTTFSGKITPNYAKKKVKIQRKANGKWRKYKTITTDGRGKWRITLPAPSRKKTYWRFSIPGDANFVGWSATGSTWRS